MLSLTGDCRLDSSGKPAKDNQKPWPALHERAGQFRAYQVARNAAIEMENGKVAEQVEVDDASVPASGAQVID